MKVVVIRPFLWDGQRQEAGAVLDVAQAAALELRHAGKVALQDALPPASVMTTQSASALVAGEEAKPKGSRK